MVATLISSISHSSVNSWYCTVGVLKAYIVVWKKAYSDLYCIVYCVKIILLTQTHGTALSIKKNWNHTGHRRTSNLVAHNLRFLPTKEGLIKGNNDIFKAHLTQISFIYVIYLTSAFGAAIHHPVFFILKQAAILPTHTVVFDILNIPQSHLHDCVFLTLRDRQGIETIMFSIKTVKYGCVTGFTE